MAERTRFTTPELGGLQLSAIRHGTAGRPPLVLLHGAGANAHWWDHWAARLSEAFHVTALEFRGHGDSDHPEVREPGSFRRDLEAVLAEIGAPDAVIVGHSLGAHVAAEHVAAGAPTRALVLLDMTRGASSSRRRATRLALTLRPTYRSREDAVRRYRFLPDAAHVSEALRLHIARHSVREEADGRFGFKFDEKWFGVRSGERPDLARIGCPTLLVRGGESALLTAEGAREIAKTIPDARVVEIAGAGHHVQLDRPEETLDAVLAFLRERLPAGA